MSIQLPILKINLTQCFFLFFIVHRVLQDQSEYREFAGNPGLSVCQVKRGHREKSEDKEQRGKMVLLEHQDLLVP